MRQTVPPLHREFARAMRRDATRAENMWWQAVRGKKLEGLKFKRQVPLDGYILDFLCMDTRLIIEVDGGQHSGSVRDAVRDLEVERIGHGVRAIENLALVDELAEKGIVLEVCPGSNVTLGIYPSFRDHPIHELDRRGVKVTISTDDPPFFHTSMAREYEEMHRAFDWDEGQFRRIARQSLDAAFCDADTKAKIAKLLEA